MQQRNPIHPKPTDYVVLTAYATAVFGSRSYAERHASLNAPAQIYRGHQVSRIDEHGGVHLHAALTTPFAVLLNRSARP